MDADVDSECGEDRQVFVGPVDSRLLRGDLEDLAGEDTDVGCQWLADLQELS
jgi:hypothetical protein